MDRKQQNLNSSTIPTTSQQPEEEQELWNSPLVQSIRSEHANLTLIAKYEVEEMESTRDLMLD
jgi:hypothetical protein